MKNLIKAVAISAMILSTNAFAADIPVEGTRLDVTGADVNLNFRIAGGASPDVKILFCDCTAGFSETSTIQPMMLWFASSPNGKTTVKQMVQDGWKISQIFSTHATNKQFYIVFLK